MRRYGGNKYGNKKTKRDGYSFASKGEAMLYEQLRLREKAKEIKDLRCQYNIRLTKANILYIADFSFYDIYQDRLVISEFKGLETDVWRIKRRLYCIYGPAPLEIWKGNKQGIYLQEIIVPSGE